MGKRSRERKSWPRRHDDASGRSHRRPHTVRRWVCADSVVDGKVQLACADGMLITCSDGLQRCPHHKVLFDKARLEQRAQAAAAARHAPPDLVVVHKGAAVGPTSVQPAGQIVHPPRVG
ncbi:MAG: hypothetical protein ACE147_00575 [Candidatus Methylomirabilales bacterium]